VLEYVKLVGRPLTGLERRTFEHYVDLMDDQEFPGWRHLDDCDCASIVPKVVQAIEPDPVDADVASRSLDGVVGRVGRGFKALVPAHQGIRVDRRLSLEHWEELVQVAVEKLADFEVVLNELKKRARSAGYPTAQAMVRLLFPEVYDIAARKAASSAGAEEKRRTVVVRTKTPRGRVQAALQDWKTLGQLAQETGLGTEECARIVKAMRDFVSTQFSDEAQETEYRMKAR